MKMYLGIPEIEECQLLSLLYITTSRIFFIIFIPLILIQDLGERPHNPIQ